MSKNSGSLLIGAIGQSPLWSKNSYLGCGSASLNDHVSQKNQAPVTERVKQVGMAPVTERSRSEGAGV